MTQANLDRIIVVAGPTCCGKTSFINNLMSGKYKNIEQKLKMGSLDSWFYQDAYYLKPNTLNELLKSSISHVLLHWTIPLPRLKIFIRNILLLGAYDKKARLNLIQSSNNVIVLSLYANPTLLLKRVELRKVKWENELNERGASFIDKIFMLHNIKTVNRFYSNPKRCLPLYNRWFKFVKNDLKPETNYLINVDSEPKIKSINGWSDIITKLDGFI